MKESTVQKTDEIAASKAENADLREQIRLLKSILESNERIIRGYEKIARQCGVIIDPAEGTQ